MGDIPDRVETELDPNLRKQSGAWFTPADLAEELMARAVANHQGPIRLIADPACGAGRLLHAARRAVPSAELWGAERNREIAAAARTYLQPSSLGGPVTIETGDGLFLSPHRRADIVIANPPFLTQYRSPTARTKDDQRRLSSHLGSSVSGTVDTAALFLLHIAKNVLARSGVAVVILPEAVLATNGGSELRYEISQKWDVSLIWRDHTGVFPGTPTCALQLAPTANPRPRRSWSYLLASEVEVPRLRTAGTIDDVATVRSDYRQFFYQLSEHLQEGNYPDVASAAAAGTPAVITVGMIDPAHLRWGGGPFRIAGARYSAPVLRHAGKEITASRLIPKLLLATQTKVLEVWVDIEGVVVPGVPVITITAPKGQLWHLAAALSSPVLGALARARHAGSALSREALRVSVRQVAELPLPPAGRSWDAAARRFREAQRSPENRDVHLDEMARAMLDAYDVRGPDRDRLMTWWQDRRPRR